MHDDANVIVESQALATIPLQRILTGGLTVGVLDGTYALVSSAVRGIGPARVFQSVASGFYGRESYRLGATTVAVGVATHFAIATSVVAVYCWMARRWPALQKHPVTYGGTYGVLVYAFMNLVVIPLSAVPFRPKLSAVIGGLLAHILLIGIPAALFARAPESKGEQAATTHPLF